MRGLVLAVGLAACADQAVVPADDNDAETAGVQPMDTDSKLVGLYASASPTAARQDGDLVALELTSTSAYVRARCYHDRCSVVVPETDHFDHYTSTSGLEYLRFWSVDITRGDTGIVTTPEVIDVYELRATAAGIELRKSRTTRWIELGSSTVATSCTVAGGTWDGATCGCPAGRSFVPGANGCIEAPGANEAKCDASNGLWTDDDATLIGSYCNCGSGRRVGRDGACAAI